MVSFYGPAHEHQARPARVSRGSSRLDSGTEQTNTEAQAREGLWRRWHLGALLAHVLLAALFTWPLVANFLPGAAARIPGVMLEDRDQNLWNLWWVREAIFSGRNPYLTDYIYYPTGVSLYFHTLNAANGLLAIPLLSVFSLITTYNIIIFFSFAVGGWGAFLLVYYLCRNRWGALVGSVVFAYSAYHIATMRNLLQLISLEWVPFFVLALLVAVYGPPLTTTQERIRWAVRRALPAALALFLVALVDWYYTLYCLMIAGLLGVYQLLRAGIPRLRGSAIDARTSLVEPLLRLGVCLAIWAFLVSPTLLPTLGELRSENYMVPEANASLANSADLLAFFQPPRFNMLWGERFNRAGWPFASNLYEVYLTYTALALALAGFFLWSRRSSGEAPLATNSETSMQRVRLPGRWFWGGCSLIFFVLALGPVLQVGGAQVRSLGSPGVPLLMPYALLEHLPALNISRSPDRFTMPLTLCLGVLAGYGLTYLLARFRLPRSRFTGPVLAVAAIALIALELFPFPYPQRSAEIPRWYTTLAKEPGDFSIFELPPQSDYWHGAFRMYYQTAHGKRIFGGYISREYRHPFTEGTPGYAELRREEGGRDMIAVSRDQQLSALAHYRTRYVVVQKDRLVDVEEPPVDVEPWNARARELLGGAPVYSDEQLSVYSVPAPSRTLPFLSIGTGWQPREEGPNGVFRWSGSVATLRVDAPRRSAATLTFRATTIGPARLMEITHGDTRVFSEPVGPLRSYSVQLGLPEGSSMLTFSSPGGTVRPADLGQGTDQRDLGFALLDVQLEEAQP